MIHIFEDSVMQGNTESIPEKFAQSTARVQRIKDSVGGS
jgi:hypothetical protein